MRAAVGSVGRVIVLVLIICFGFSIACGWATPGERVDRKRTSSMFRTDDGNTQVWYSNYKKLGDIVDLWFCDRTGTIRGEVIGRHGWQYHYLSPEGYFVVWGTVKDREGLFITLYDNSGKRLYEVPAPADEKVMSLSVSQGGRRTALLISHDMKALAYGSEIVLLDGNGKHLARVPTERNDTKFVQFTADGSALLAQSQQCLQLLDVDKLRRKWQLDGLAFGVMQKAPFTLTADHSKMAVLASLFYGSGDKAKVRTTVLVIDVKTGKLLSDVILEKNLQLLSSHQVLFDESKNAFEVTIRGQEPITVPIEKQSN